MHLDLPTLMFVGGLLGPICGSVLAVIWWQHRDNTAPLWWGAGHATQGSAVILFAYGFVDGWAWSFPVALTLVIVAPALIWVGTRAFWRKPVGIYALAGGAILWAAAGAALGGSGNAWALPLVNTAIVIGFVAASAWDMATGVRERLRARLPLVVLMAVNIAVYLLSIPDAVGGQLSDGPPPLTSLFGLIHFETMIYIIGTTIFFVALIKERGELQQREEAQTDVLTGLPNRRAFLSGAERVAERHRRDNEPFAVAVFDLDHFKRVNDTYGHAVGDRTLQVFADAARQSLRPADLFSRIGGEEFAGIFPGADLNTGLIMAERVRRAFAEAGLVVDGRDIRATVSAGVSVAMPENSPTDEDSLTDLMERADVALYKAKLNGRDRVECDHDGRRPRRHLVQVA